MTTCNKYRILCVKLLRAITLVLTVEEAGSSTQDEVSDRCILPSKAHIISSAEPLKPRTSMVRRSS